MAEEVEQLGRSLQGGPPSATVDEERKRDVVLGSEGVEKVERLEHDAERPAAERSQLILTATCDPPPPDLDLPASLGSRPAITLTRVDLPPPEGPVRVTISPLLTSRSTPRRALIASAPSPYSLYTPRN